MKNINDIREFMSESNDSDISGWWENLGGKLMLEVLSTEGGKQENADRAMNKITKYMKWNKLDAGDKKIAKEYFRELNK